MTDADLKGLAFVEMSRRALLAGQDVYREASERWFDFSKHRDMFICGHENRMMAYDCTLLAMGWSEILGKGVDGPALARRYGVTRAQISSIVAEFKLAVNL